MPYATFTTPSQYLPGSASVTSAFGSCLTAPSASCDETVGSEYIGSGLCSGAPWNTTIYCSCVNNIVPCAEVTTPVCSNTAFAYKPSVENPACPSKICVNTIENQGSGSVVENAVLGCGSYEQSFFSYSLVLWFVLVLLIIAIVFTVYKLKTNSTNISK